MSDILCMVCKELNTGDTQTVRLTDNDGKSKIDITGHITCTDIIYNQTQEMKDFKSMRLETVVKKLKLDVSL